jgi:hypothetical protein
MEILEQSKVLNILIPKLIDKTQHLQKEMKSRIKLNKIFSEFENKATNKLNYFIANSVKRYTCTKFGNDLDSYLLNTRTKNLYEANKIIKDKFYSDSNLEKEKEKMKYKSTSKIYKDINDIFKQIKIPLESEFNKQSKRKIKLILNSLKNNPSMNDLFIRKEKLKIIKNYNKHYMKKNLINDKYLISTVLEKEQESIGNSINNYLNNVENKILNNELNNNSSTDNPISLSSRKRKLKLDLPNIKLINYRYNKKINIIKIEDTKTPDIKKLLPYSKMSQKPFKKRKIINDSFNIENNKQPFLTEANIHTNKSNDYHNTVNLVFNSASEEFRLQNNLDKRRRKLDDILGINEIPKLDSYDEIITKKFEEIKNERREKAKKISDSQRFESLSNKEKARIMINNSVKLFKFFKK